MEAMPNLGSDYVRRFRAIFPALARANAAALIPFLLEGVAGVDSLNQDDGIHPTPAGQRIVAENVWRVVERVTRRKHTGRHEARPALSSTRGAHPSPPTRRTALSTLGIVMGSASLVAVLALGDGLDHYVRKIEPTPICRRSLSLKSPEVEGRGF
jgi:hypothetical protein